MQNNIFRYKKIAILEREISKKYGKEAIQDPRKSWNDKKEQKYQKK